LARFWLHRILFLTTVGGKVQHFAALVEVKQL
jgi:hypothetical protein